jgi:hypothetical protein
MLIIPIVITREISAKVCDQHWNHFPKLGKTPPQKTWKIPPTQTCCLVVHGQPSWQLGPISDQTTLEAHASLVTPHPHPSKCPLYPTPTPNETISPSWNESSNDPQQNRTHRGSLSLKFENTWTIFFFLSWKMGHQTTTRVQSWFSHFFSPLAAKVDVQWGDQKTKKKKKTVFSLLRKRRVNLRKMKDILGEHILRHPKTKGTSNAHSKTTWPVVPPLSYVVQLCRQRFYCALGSRQQLGTSQKQPKLHIYIYIYI